MIFFSKNFLTLTSKKGGVSEWEGEESGGQRKGKKGTVMTRNTDPIALPVSVFVYGL